MAICPVCGKVHTAGARNCDLCGAPLAYSDAPVGASSSGQGQSQAPPQQAFSGPICPKCMRSNRSISAFCAYCGYKLKPSASQQPYVLPNTNNAPISTQHSALSTQHSDEPGNLPSGTLLKKRYRIMRKIAQGGMGAVYESSDIHAASEVRWAVKEISPAALPASERKQAITDFRKEAQMLASLEHPNLPKVVETFEEMGKHFLVMEFVAGSTLQNVMDGASGFLPEDRVRVWTRQIMDVLTYLHAQTPPIIYRDLKPANVMILDGTERIKMIDFGIARFHKAGKNQDTEAFGTAGYAPPEQYGKGQTDQRSDVYALGATLHYLTTKHDPSLNPFNWLPVRRYNPALSAQFEVALQTALNLDPQRRFANISDFAGALGLQLSPVYVQPAQPQPLPAQAPRKKSQSQPPKSSVAAPTKQKPQPTPPPVADPAISYQLSAISSRPTADSRQPTAIKEPPAPIKRSEPFVQTDHGTTKGAGFNPAHTPHFAPRTPHSVARPSLMASKYLVDLGEAGRKKKPLIGKVELLNVGTGELEGTVSTREAWLVPSFHKFRGQTQTVEVRIRKAALPLGRVELQVPNLFAIIWARARWALPFIGFWLWVLLLVASSAGQMLLTGLAGALGVIFAAQAVLWIWRMQVRWLVPAAKLNTGRLLVKSTGGEQQVEVRVKSRPSRLRVATGWLSAGLLTSAEVGTAAWLALVFLELL